jgi:replicative DNA helicase
MDSFPPAAGNNAFSGLAPSQDFDSKQSNFIIRPSRMDDLDDEPPF